jgi:uncharacterized OB-fold protein
MNLDIAEMAARYRLRCPKCGECDYLFNKPRHRSACDRCSSENILALMELVDLATGTVLETPAAAIQWSFA